MSLLFTKSKKLERLKAARKKLPKPQRMFFVALMVLAAMSFQSTLQGNARAFGSANEVHAMSHDSL